MRKRGLEFVISDFFYLKVSPMKGVERFGKKGKLSPCYVSSYKIMGCFSIVTYELYFPTNLASVHLVFHVSLLRKCIGDPAFVIPLESVV